MQRNFAMIGIFCTGMWIFVSHEAHLMNRRIPWFGIKIVVLVVYWSLILRLDRSLELKVWLLRWDRRTQRQLAFDTSVWRTEAGCCRTVSVHFQSAPYPGIAAISG